MEIYESGDKVYIIKNKEKRSYPKKELKSLVRRVVNNNHKGIKNISISKLVYENKKLRFEMTKMPEGKENSVRRKNFVSCLKQYDSNIIFLDKEKVMRLIEEILGVEKRKKFEMSMEEREVEANLEVNGEKIIFENSLCKKRVDISKETIREKFMQVMLGNSYSSKIKKEIAFEHNIDRFTIMKRQTSEHPCIVCKENNDRESIQLINSSSPFVVCSNCYVEFLCEYTDSNRRKIIANTI